MFMINAITLVLVFEAIVIQVTGVPLRVIGPDGSPEAVKRVKDATADANSLVGKMEKVHEKAVNGDKDSIEKIQKAFGVTPDMKGIGDNIQKLKDGKFRMDNAQAAGRGGLGSYDPNKKLVELGSGFHSGLTEPEFRAGVILHEASHAILGTGDVFNSKGEPTKQAKPTNPGDKVGYKESHLPKMLEDPKFSKNLHQNADSWRLFGDLCRRELERRALEEPDLMKRDEILRVRAAACSLPARKLSTPVKAAGNGDASKAPARAANNPAARGANKPTAPAATKPAPARSASKPAVRGANKPAPADGVSKSARDANKLVARPGSKPARDATKPVARPPNKPVAHPASKAAVHSAKKSAPAPAANKPAPARGANKPVARPALKPAAGPANKSAARDTNKPVARPASKPAARPAANSAPAPATNKPAAGLADKSAPAALKPATEPTRPATKAGRK